MKGKRREEGATLVVLVLMVMVILAGVIVVSANLAVNSRRNTTDQRALLQAQYRAESGVSQAQAQLDFFNLLTDNLKPANSIYRNNMQDMFVNICNEAGAPSNINTASNLPSFVTLDSTHPIKNLNGLVFCDLTNKPAPAVALSALFKNYFNTTNPTITLSAMGLNGTKLDSYMASVFKQGTLNSDGTLSTPSNSTSNPLSFGIIPIAVTRPGLDVFNFVFMVSDLKSTGNQSNGMRSIRSDATDFSKRQVYTLTIAKPSFAKYALFTNHHYSNLSDSSTLWFTKDTQFSGPVHTNQNFNFSSTPYFGGKITSAGCPAGQIKTDAAGADYCAISQVSGARFYNNSQTNIQNVGSINSTTKNVNGKSLKELSTTGNTSDKPIVGDAKWNSDFVQLPENGQSQIDDSKNITNINGINQTGIYLGSAIKKISYGISNAGSVKYQTINYTKSDSKEVYLRFDENRTVQINTGTVSAPIWTNASKNLSTGEWQAATLPGGSPAKFNGVIYSKGGIKSVYGNTDPAVASFAQMTLASDQDIVLTGNLKYEQSPCDSGTAKTANCSSFDSNGNIIQNVLGIYSSNGDIEIANNNTTTNSNNTTQNTDPDKGSLNAPNDLTVQAVLMASKGAVQVQNYNSGKGGRGSFNLTGGVIENVYGAFFTFNGTTGAQSTGFNRNFVYDPRMDIGFSPPSFPTQKNWDISLKYNLTAGDKDSADASKILLTGNIRQAAP
ncbi:DUF4900 domain-containing protein [Deinococcus psychrotolerans]|uniref:DUF4900 domain-containing protein n=1 Tax=Deinococcus psychrotolerans TaxID=2489213 RepID=A0A3G8YAE2_9DEIO|nr:DUF4900 domain-containing protein [Deinococcus psychrotolerans]AZI42339.1 DUF4900 domain-containing protein [Deinococcus psychrotolerans]